ncbi:MAG: hypothetical protein ACT4OY_03950 [Alphaproteobacteria bacterium]
MQKSATGERVMRAYGTPGGGVMFVPDEIDNVAAKKACALANEKKILRKDPAPEAEKRFSLFGRRRKNEGYIQKAA